MYWKNRDVDKQNCCEMRRWNENEMLMLRKRRNAKKRRNAEKKQDVEKNKMLMKKMLMKKRKQNVDKKNVDEKKERNAEKKTKCWKRLNVDERNVDEKNIDERNIDSAHYINHFSFEKFIIIFFVFEILFFHSTSIRFLNSIEITTLNRIDVAKDQFCCDELNRRFDLACYWCFSDWLIVANEIKFFRRKLIDCETIVWW